MPKITYEQAIKWSKPCQNGFALNIETYVCRGEKELVTSMPLADGRTLKGCLCYQREVVDHRPTGRSIPMLHLSVWKPVGGVMVSYGTGRFVTMGEPIPRKTLSVLQGLTAVVDDDFMLRHFDPSGAEKAIVAAVTEAD